MSLLAVRLLISAAMFTAPFALLAFGSKRTHSDMWLLFPLFAAVPGVLGALILFAPLEALLDSRGMQISKNFAVPAAGALIAPILLLVMTAKSGKLRLVLSRYSKDGRKAWGPLVLWMVLGAIFGVMWRSTEWIAAFLGLRNA